MPSRNSQTDEYVIAVDFAQVTETNGSPISSYHVEIDNGKGGDYVTIKGNPENDLTLFASKKISIEPGLLYRVRYRAKNEVGFGDFSDPGYILAAGVPYEPDKTKVEIIGNKVIISWVMPYNAGSLIKDA